MAVLNYVIECWVQQMFNINFTTFEEFFLRKKRVESCESAKTENLASKVKNEGFLISKTDRSHHSHDQTSNDTYDVTILSL